MKMEWENLLCSVRDKKSSDSRVQGDLRDEFDRDFDRIIYSTPFRRLQDKTQVFPLEPNDSVRTRLTHSLEVSRAARGLANDVCHRLMEQGHIREDQLRCIETIASTAALLHDLGNPPFGHSGEVAIRDWFLRDGNDALEGLDDSFAKDFRHFEGNAQTLRLVTKLQILADFRGLNLTYGTLSAACKYIAGAETRNDEIHEFSKLGYFQSEKDILGTVWDITGTGCRRNPIAFLVEAADDAVYNTVDLEDGFKKGLLDWSVLKRDLREDKITRDAVQWSENRVDRAEVTLEGRSKDSALFKYFRVRAIAGIITAAAKTFLRNYDAIMAGDYHGELANDSEAGQLLQSCKKLNHSKVYCSEETLKLELMGRQIIWDLMDLFWEGAKEETSSPTSFASKAFSLLSDNYRRVFDHSKKMNTLPLKYYQIQLVTDYICGMTDTFAAELHRRIKNG